MRVATNAALNAYAQALGTIEDLERGMHKAIADFKALKSGEWTLDQLVVTDDGWEFTPPEPEEEQDDGSNGAFTGGLSDAAHVG